MDTKILVSLNITWTASNYFQDVFKGNYALTFLCMNVILGLNFYLARKSYLSLKIFLTILEE